MECSNTAASASASVPTTPVSADVLASAGASVHTGAPVRRFTPYLRASLDVAPSEYARSTCFAGGYLTSPNAGWRSERPVIDHVQCTLCLQCYMHCPDGTIYKVRNEEETLVSLGIDLDFCKGCGVCVQVCPSYCIEMVPERDCEVEDA